MAEEETLAASHSMILLSNQVIKSLSYALYKWDKVKYAKGSIWWGKQGEREELFWNVADFPILLKSDFMLLSLQK